MLYVPLLCHEAMTQSKVLLLEAGLMTIHQRGQVDEMPQRIIFTMRKQDSYVRVTMETWGPGLDFVAERATRLDEISFDLAWTN